MNYYITEIQNLSDRILKMETKFEVFVSDPSANVYWTRNTDTGDKQRYKIIPRNNCFELEYKNIPVTKRPASAKSSLHNISETENKENKPVHNNPVHPRPSSASGATKNHLTPARIPLFPRRHAFQHSTVSPVIVNQKQAARLRRA